MGGRPRLYDDIPALPTKRPVQIWLQGMKEGAHQKTALYNLARYLRWRKVQGLESDPEKLIDDCLKGTNQTLVLHLRPLMEYCEGKTFDGASTETKKKNAKDIRAFYMSNLIFLPRAKIRGREANNPVNEVVTASKFLQFAKTVLLKSRLSSKGRALMLYN